MRTTPQGTAMLAALLVVFSGAPRAVAAQQEVTLRRILSVDSIGMPAAQLSPDGRWIVLRVMEDDGTSSLWMAPAGGGARVRLTSAGFEDRFPAWFRSGDRIAFGTTRFGRNGGRQLFLAVQSIDPATGRAVGVPRQVSGEPISRHGQPSPDGRWIPYVSAGAAPLLRVVPATGGTARTLVRPEGAIGSEVFGPDSRHVYYREVGGTPGAMRFTLKRVAVSGESAPEVVASAVHPLFILPADPRYVIHQVADAPLRFEIRTATGAVVGGTTLPRGMAAPTYSGDGWGIMGVMGEWTGSTQVVPVDGGAPKELASGGKHWPEAWMPDGSTLIVDREGGDSYIVETLPIAGGATKSVRLPPGAVQSGWHSSVGPWMSYRVRAASNTADVLGAVNVLSGERRTLSSAAVRIGTSGRGGYEQDGARWIYVERNATSGRLELHAADPATGVSSRILTLPAEHRFGPGVVLAVHGNRVAYKQSRGDSTDLFLLDASGPHPRKLATFSKDGDTVTWSWDGSRLAVADWIPGSPRRGGIHVFHVGDAGAPRMRRFDLGVENGCDGFTWTPDDLHVVMLCYGATGRIMKLRLSDGHLGTVVPGDRPQQIWEYYLSPDGRRIAYTVQRGAGSSVYVGSFKPILETKR